MKILIVAFVLSVMAGALFAACGSTTTTSSTASSATTAASTPGGAGGAPPGGAPPGGGGTAVYPTNAAYTQSGGTKSEDGQTYTATEQDQSGILVSDGGKFTVTKATVNTSGNSSSNDSSSFYGLNAAVIATSSSAIDMSDSTITTTGSGANGAFATGQGSSVTLSNVTIEATGGGAHGVMATQGGSVTLTNVNINTAGASSAPLATDRGGGTVTATGGNVVCSGQNSPCLYSTGTLNVTGGTYQATGAEAAVIEGANFINLTDVDLSSTFGDKWGVMIYQSMSGDATGTQGTFTVTGGSLSYTGANGPLFYVNNSTGIITLKGVTVTVASGVLVKAAAGNWGTSGSNGGHVVLTADGQSLTGDLTADNISTINLTLENLSSLTGSINAQNTAKEVNLVLDDKSVWTVTADSYLTSVTFSAGISGTTITNIVGNGHTVYYDATNSANSALGGKTYSLNGGGVLTPAS